MKKSYLAVVEYDPHRPPEERTVYYQSFTGRAKTRSQKAIDEADAWIAATLREHGTQNVRCYLTEVMFCIIG